MADDVTIAIGAQDKASAVIDKVASKVGAMPNLLKAGAIGDVVTGIESAFRMLSGAVNAVAQPLIEVSNQIDALTDKARGLGESVGDLRSFQFAMEEAGNVSAEGSIRALQKIQRIIGEVASGKNESAGNIFKTLKIDADQLALDRPVAQFNAVREAIAGIRNVAERAAVAQSLLGKSASDLLPALIAEKSAFDDSIKAAKELGIAVSDVGAESIARMNDAIGRAQTAFEGLYTHIAVAVAPAVENVAMSIAEFMPPIIKIATVYGPMFVEQAIMTAAAWTDLAEAAYRFVTLDWDKFDNLVDNNLGARGEGWIKDFRDTMKEAQVAAIEQGRLASQVAAIQRQADNDSDAENTATKVIESLQRRIDVEEFGVQLAREREELESATNVVERVRITSMQQQLNLLNEQNEARKKAEDDAFRAQQAASQTIESLQRRVDVERLGLDVVREREELALATNDAERERIEALQLELALIEEQNAKRKKAEEEARQREEDRKNALRQEEERRQRNAEALRRDPGQLQAVESRLLTRGVSSQDSVLEWAKRQYEILQRQLKTNEENKAIIKGHADFIKNQNSLRVEQIA